MKVSRWRATGVRPLSHRHHGLKVSSWMSIFDHFKWTDEADLTKGLMQCGGAVSQELMISNIPLFYQGIH
jgi:hypothetical protein